MCCCCARPHKNKSRSNQLPHPSALAMEHRMDEEAAINHPQYKSSPRSKEPLPPNRPYLWSSSYTDHANKEFRFQGFEPCYIACIKDLEHRLKVKAQSIDIVSDSPGLTEEIAPMLLQYSQLVEALQTIECKDRVFEDDIWKTEDVVSKYSGEKRRITRLENDYDPLHAHLQKNLVLVLMGYLYNWDFADNMKRRYGNVTKTVDRVLLGLGGGAFLLVPMIIMSTGVMQVSYRLIIVCVATILFALTMSLTTTSRDSLVAATAAYAAVMVVYIGSSGTGTG